MNKEDKNINKKSSKSQNNTQEVIFSDTNKKKVNTGSMIIKKAALTNMKQKLESHKSEVIAKYSKLKLLLSEYLDQIDEGKGTKYFYNNVKPELRAAIKKSTIAAVALLAEPQKKSSPGSTVIAIATKSRGDIPPTALYDFPINQLFELDLFFNDVLQFLTKSSS